MSFWILKNSTIINQLEKWQALFEKLKGEGLTSSEQQGLYGELHFTHDCENIAALVM